MDAFLTFLPLAALIALVCSGTRHESLEDILQGAFRLFVTLVAGTVIFSVVLHGALQFSTLFYALLAVTLGLLAFYTFKEVAAWLMGGPKKDEA